MSENTNIQLQISDNIEFTNILTDKSGNYNNGFIELSDTDFSGEGGDPDIPYGETLYSRVRYSSDKGSSQWAEVVNFTIYGPWDKPTPGTVVVITDHEPICMTCARLSNTQVIVAYRRLSSDGTINYVHSLVLGISGTTITTGTIVTCGYRVHSTHDDEGHGYSLYVVALTTTKAVVVYDSPGVGDGDHQDSLWSRVLTISGSNITQGTPKQCNKFDTDKPILVRISDTKVMITYGVYVSSNINSHSYIQILNISGTTVTPESATLLYSYRTSNRATVLLNENKILYIYTKRTENNNLYALVFTISGNTVTAGTPVKCNSYDTYGATLINMNGTKAIVTYGNAGDNNRIYSQILTISGTTVTYSSPLSHGNIFSTELLYRAAIHAIPTNFITDNKFVVTFVNKNGGNLVYTYSVMVSGNNITTTTPIKCTTIAATRLSAAVVTPSLISTVFKSGNKLYSQVIAEY